MLHPLTMLQHLMPEKAYRYASPPEHPRHVLSTPPPLNNHPSAGEEGHRRGAAQAAEPRANELRVQRDALLSRVAHGAAAVKRLLQGGPNPHPHPNPDQVLPWNTYSKEDFELARAEKILAQDHYGLDDIKVSSIGLQPEP